MAACRVIVTDRVPRLAGTSYLADDGTVWIVVSARARQPVQLVADLMADAFDGRLPDTLTYDRTEDGGQPPEPAGEVRRLDAGDDGQVEDGGRL